MLQIFALYASDEINLSHFMCEVFPLYARRFSLYARTYNRTDKDYSFGGVTPRCP